MRWDLVALGEVMLRLDPGDGRIRIDQHIGLQELFFDKHLRDVSPRFDFDSIRIGKVMLGDLPPGCWCRQE